MNPAPRLRWAITIAGVISAVSLATACSPADDDDDASGSDPTVSASEGTDSAASDPCAIESLNLQTPGTLTVGTDSPAFPPWFEDDDPTNGKGFESAVAYAVAEQMGFTQDQVQWVQVPFNKSYAPGPKDFDFDINDSSLADLKDAKLGAQIGTTSLTEAEEAIDPTTDVAVFDDTNAAKQALVNGQVDAIVADLGTALYITAVEIPNSTIVGQFPTANDPEQFGLLFEKGNPLVDCVNPAIETLRNDGTLDDLQQQWIENSANIPTLQ